MSQKLNSAVAVIGIDIESDEKCWVAEPQQTPNVGIVELEPTRNFRGIGIIPGAKLAHPYLGLY